MNQVVANNEKTMPTIIRGILESEQGNKRVNDFFNNDKTKVQRFKTNLINIAGNQLLSQCTPNSIIKSAFALAEVGLDINQTLKQAYILKYASDAEPVISYKGWQVLLKNAGIQVRAFCVYKCDVFKMDYSTFSGSLEFIPNFLDRDETNKKWFSENFLGVVVRTKEKSNELFYFVSVKKIEKIKGCSPSVKRGNKSPYDEWFEEMYLAKAIKYIASKIPASSLDDRLARAMELESEVESRIQRDNQEVKINSFESLLKNDSEVKEMVVDSEIPQI